MDIEKTFRRGQTPTVEQWAQLKEQGWTVEKWNAEMDQRRADNGRNPDGSRNKPWWFPF